MACATAIICVALLRVERAPAQQRYQLYNLEDISEASGKTIKSIYRLDTVNGRTWRMSMKPALTSGMRIITWGEGWEEMPESLEAGVTKAQEEFRRAAANQLTQPTASPAQ